MGDVIRVRGVRVRARHGVFPAERETDQPFVADLDVGCDLAAAAADDDLDQTLSYAWLAEVSAAVLAGPPADLIETLAGRIAEQVMRSDFVEFVTVTVHKPQAPMPVACADAAVTIHRERDLDAVIALGANLGDRARTMTTALADLDAVDGVRVRGVSGLIETDPVGPPQPDYLNAVATVATRLHPSSLLRAMHAIEARHGRRRVADTERDGPRTLDLDLIQVGDPARGTDLAGRYGDLQLPHPRAAERAFVLAPWLQVAPFAVLRTPDGPRDVADVLAALPDDARAGIRPARDHPRWPGRPAGRGRPRGSRAEFGSRVDSW